MARLAVIALAVTCLSTLAAAGPHYMADHDAEQARLMHRRAHGSSGYVSGAGGVHNRLARRSEGSKRADKRSCKPRTSSPSSANSGGDGGSTATATSSAASSSSTGTLGGSASGDGGNIVSSALSAIIKATGITAFINDNTNAIASWYHTNSGGDSTNGHSWCGYAYSDSTPGFAPNVDTMLDNFGGNYVKAATAYCGLEAIITTPDGKSVTGYIADGFDPRWVRTPTSIDLIFGLFTQLYGSETNNKNVVVTGASWKLTGNRSKGLSFKGSGQV